jgi:hypothetical protein
VVVVAAVGVRLVAVVNLEVQLTAQHIVEIVQVARVRQPVILGQCLTLLRLLPDLLVVLLLSQIAKVLVQLVVLFMGVLYDYYSSND